MASLKIVFPLLFCFLSASAFAKPKPVKQINEQKLSIDTIPDAIQTDNIIYDKVEIEASFPGGDNAWRNFLEQNINAATPVEYGAPAGTYTIIVQFVVDKEGKISDIRALTHHGYGMEAEVIRLLKKAPKWIPAFQDGRQVKAYRKQPVTFMVTVEKKKKKRD